MAPNFVIPAQISSPVDIGRLVREVDAINEHLLQLGIRQAGTKVTMPKTSHLMDKMIETNKLNLLQPEDRLALRQFLMTVRIKSPVLHISFSADPSAVFTEKLVEWLRREIHPEVLLTVGLQPSIGAGCVVRGTNKYFDFSLRQNLIKNRNLLLSKLTVDQVEATT